MKKNTLLIILSILELLTIIIFCITLKTVIEKGIQEIIGGIINSLGASSKVTLTDKERMIIKINSIMPYVFLVINICRFIFTSKKNKIVMVISFLAIIISLLLISTNINYIEVIGAVIGLVSIILYFYSHKIDFRDVSKISLKHT